MFLQYTLTPEETCGFQVNFICFKTNIQNMFVNHPSMICDIKACELFNVVICKTFKLHVRLSLFDVLCRFNVFKQHFFCSFYDSPFYIVTPSAVLINLKVKVMVPVARHFLLPCRSY